MGYKIAIDGPAGAGKGYLAKELSKKLELLYVDTGAMYRAFGLYVMRNSIDLENEYQILDALAKCDIELKVQEGDDKVYVYLNGEDVSEEIRNESAGMMAVKVSTIKLVRYDMVERQRELGRTQDIVMEGRDITSNVFPDADVKIYLTATTETRAARRLIDLKEKGIETNIEELIEEIKKRDQADYTKPISPLIKTEDAIEVDTTNMTREQVLEHVLEIIKMKGREL